MAGKTYKMNFCDLGIDASQIETILGYQEGEDREVVSGLIEEILAESSGLCNIKAEYRIFTDVQLDSINRSLRIENTNFDIKKIVSGQFKNIESVAVLLCTAGEEIGIRSKTAMQERDLLKGYLYDVVGSVTVEAAAEIVMNELEEEAAVTGRKTTAFYSPGYCGWDVGEQHKLFNLVPYNYCGIRLTESALMDPVKSVSGFIGIGAHVIKNPDTCLLCNMKDCSYRKSRVKSAAV